MSQFFKFSAQMLPRFKQKISDMEANETKQVNPYFGDSDMTKNGPKNYLTLT